MRCGQMCCHAGFPVVAKTYKRPRPGHLRHPKALILDQECAMRAAILTVILTTMLSSAMFCQSLSPQASTAAQELISETPTPGFASPVNLAPALPPVPTGKATVIGGSIRNVDRLRDELTLNIYGGHPMRVFFDERTQI